MKELFGSEDDNPFGGNIVGTSEEISYEQIDAVDPRGVEFGVGDGMYCPAFSVLMGTVFAGQNPEQLQVGDRRLTWWEDDSVVPKWPVTLINPLTWAQSNQLPDDMSRDKLGMDPEEMYVFADSGGFQVKTFENMCVVDSADLHSFEDQRVMPEKLLEWQAKNATAGAILDFSPYIVESNQGETEGLGGVSTDDFYDELFVPNLKQTVENAERMLDHKQRIGANDFQLFNVLHGTVPFDDSLEPAHHIQKWYDTVDPIGSFDGWGIGAGSTNIAKLPLNLAFVSENIDETHLHLFGTGSLAYRAVIEYWRLYDGDEYAITSDSTSFEVGSQYRQFFNPLIHGKDLSVSKRTEDRESIVADVTPCTCSVCTQMEREYGPRWVWERDDGQIGVALNLHNLNLFFQRHRTIQAVVQGSGTDLPERYFSCDGDTAVFWTMMDRIFSRERIESVWQCMKFIKRAQEDGFDNACDDFVFHSAYDDVEGPLIYEKSVRGFDEW